MDILGFSTRATAISCFGPMLYQLFFDMHHRFGHVLLQWFSTSPRSTPSTAHFVCLPISDKPTSGIAVSTNELMGWIRCDRWGRHTICAGLEVLQDRFENHWVMAVPSYGNEPCQYNVFWHLLCYNIAKSFLVQGWGTLILEGHSPAEFSSNPGGKNTYLHPEDLH